MCSRNAFPIVVSEFASRDPVEMAELSGTKFEGNNFYLQYCNHSITAAYPSGEVKFLETGKNFKREELTHDEKIIILQYLTSASGLPQREQWLSFLDLRGGQLHWMPFQREALEPLARNYFNSMDRFLKLGLEHGGSSFDKGDAGVVIPVLPRISLAFILWQGCEEFAPRSMILFDSAAETYLATATLYVLAIQALIHIWFPGDTRFDSVNPRHQGG
ncbi:MAG: DUF3786 domain-containing protein [Bacillota bacterium]|nr:DUF3786 domain-containing protein [Bacillota bacterium]